MSSQLWKEHYEEFWKLHPDRSRFSEKDCEEAQRWADYLVRHQEEGTE